MCELEFSLNHNEEIIHLLMPWYGNMGIVFIDEPDLMDIIQICINVYGITPESLNIRVRKGPIRECRQVIHFYAKLKTNHSFSVIGENIGHLDSSTVIHSQYAVTDTFDTNVKFRDKILELCALMGVSPNTLSTYLQSIRDRRLKKTS